MLTIAIPTFNRNESLKRNLALLLPQLTSECRLMILDNCSPTPVDETLRELLSGFPEVNCEIVRHAANIGGNANILRCIERCQTPWVWILGDDDPPFPAAIATILTEIEANADCMVLNFSTDSKREKEWTTRGVDELAQTLDGSADLPWISNSVYRTEPFKANLKFGYQYIYSMLPHIAVMLMALGEGGKCAFARASLVDSETRDVELRPEQQWSVVNLALGFPILFDLPLSLGARQKLFEKLLLTNLRPGVASHGVVFQLLLLAVKQRDSRQALYYFDQIRSRAAWNQNFKFKLETRVYRLLLQFPRLSARLYRVLKGRALSAVNYQDRFDRM